MANFHHRESSVTPSKLKSCIWRGDEGDGISFDCLYQDVKKRVTPSDCEKCPLIRPSHLVVDSAPEPRPAQVEPEAKKETTAEYLARGVVGLGKSILGIDRASDETIKERWEICRKCEFYKLWQCTKCGCIASQKVKQQSETCPAGYWKS